jgi:cobalt-zinc-cadmium efflux system outer membrane protein
MKRLCRFLTVAWLLILSAHTSSFAAESVVLPVEITIEEALRVLREESPRWAAEQAQLGLAQAEVIQAGLIANPSVTYSVLQLAQGANTGAATSHQLTVEQPLLMFGQRGKRILAAQASVTSVSASVAARLAERSRELHHTFVELLGVQ